MNKISVIVPTFQGERYLAELLSSIDNQTRLPDELVISIDDSTDETEQIVLRHKKDALYHVNIVLHERCGISANYSHALDHASGDIVIVGDHDDRWMPRKIEIIDSVFQRNADVSIVSFDSEICDAEMNFQGTTLRGGHDASRQISSLVNEDDFTQFLIGVRADAHTLAFRSLVKNPFNQIRDYHFDGFWFENKIICAAMCIGKLYYIEECLTQYRQHSSQHIGMRQQSIWDNVKRDDHGMSHHLVVLKKLFDSNRNSILFEPDEFMRRRDILGQYCEFVNIRQYRTGGLSGIVKLLQSYINKDYKRFTRRNTLSLMKDLYLSVMAHYVQRKV